MSSAVEKIAIPRFRGAVAPCFGYSLTIEIFTAKDRQLLTRSRFSFSSDRTFDRIRLLRDQGIDTLICGGIQCAVETMVRANGIRVIAWVSGAVDDVLDLYLRGELQSAPTAGTASDTDDAEDREIEPDDGHSNAGVRKK